MFSLNTGLIAELNRYKTLSDKNRFREWKLAPERGVIKDFFDREIASNEQVYQVHLIPENSKAKCAITPVKNRLISMM